ncbi:MAG TPA: hypothetical protein VIK08_10700 [Candidatus Limnocylindrales bacterium]
MTSQPRPDNHSAGLTLAELAVAKGLPEDFLHGHGLRDDWYYGQPAVAMEYRTAEGARAYDRWRIALTGDRFRQPAGVTLIPYGLDKLMTEGNPPSIVLCEGETDALTCWLQGIPALGIPGASSFQDAWASYIDALLVYVIQEPDIGGQTLVSTERCADCGSEVVRRLGARGPLPTRCNLCATRRQPRIQLRAYLRSSQRLALRLGLSVVEGLARQAIDDLDQPKAPRS